MSTQSTTISLATPTLNSAEFDQAVKRASELRGIIARGSAEGASSSAQQAKDTAVKELNTLKASRFEQIIMDPTLTGSEKFTKIMQLAGGTLTAADSNLISMLSQDFAQVMSTLTNMIKSVHDTLMNAIRNIRS